jgi:thiol-disulfide isomerase/thioredoxin
MKRKGLILISTVLIVALAVFYNQKNGVEVVSGPAAQLKNLPGFEWSQVKGKPFVVHFWAKWCAPCAEEIPHLVEFAQVASSKLPGLKILAVSLDQKLEESKSILPKGGEGLPGNFILFLDSEHTVAEAMGSYQYPETYFFDSEGKVIEKWVGPQKWNQPEVMEYFERKLTDLAL